MNAVVTRFAPSPTGELHLGNVRTALFSMLMARSAGGRFVLRIEDTDAARTTEVHVEALARDLRWLGIDWDEGPRSPGATPGSCGANGPYRQSQRAEVYGPLLARLEAQNLAYPCFCSPAELELSRRAQLAAGRPPRYAGTCAALDAAGRTARARSGARASLRFRIPPERQLRFEDLVHGVQHVDCAHIGDFVIRRDDGTPAFFFANAVDDSLMHVSHVLRGEDHLANTPRQLLVLEALSLRTPQYGHLPLLTGADGAPLSKRNGAQSVRELRELGYGALALCNQLFRLGHSSPEHGLLSVEAMAAHFEVAHLQRASAHFDPIQMRHWQGLWVRSLSLKAALTWVEPYWPVTTAETQRSNIMTALLPNLVTARDIVPWLPVVLGGDIAWEDEARAAVHAAGAGFFAKLVAAVESTAAAGAAAASTAAMQTGAPALPVALDLATLRLASGLKGAAFFVPFRAALTGRLRGPELAPLLKAMSPQLVRARLEAWAH